MRKKEWWMFVGGKWSRKGVILESVTRCEWSLKLQSCMHRLMSRGRETRPLFRNKAFCHGKKGRHPPPRNHRNGTCGFSFTHLAYIMIIFSFHVHYLLAKRLFTDTTLSKIWNIFISRIYFLFMLIREIEEKNKWWGFWLVGDWEWLEGFPFRIRKERIAVWKMLDSSFWTRLVVPLSMLGFLLSDHGPVCLEWMNWLRIQTQVLLKYSWIMDTAFDFRLDLQTGRFYLACESEKEIW